VSSVLKFSDASFKSISGGVTAPGVVKFIVGLSYIFLGISCAEMDGNIDTTIDSFWFLSFMNGNAGEALVSER